MKLDKSPLVLVLGQVVIKKVGIEVYADRIQEHLRKMGFTEHRQHEVHDLAMTVEGPKFAGPGRKIWESKTANLERSIMLSNEVLVLQDAAYDRFDSFLSQWVDLIQATNSAAEDLHITRIGLRYVDWVQPENPATPLQDFLQQQIQVTWAPAVFKDNRTNFFQYSASTNAGGVMCIRAAKGLLQDYLPMDLATNAPRADRATDFSRESLVLDFDHFLDLSETPMLFSADAFRVKAQSLHDDLIAAFKEMTTPFAMQEWKHKND